MHGIGERTLESAVDLLSMGWNHIIVEVRDQGRGWKASIRRSSHFSPQGEGNGYGTGYLRSIIEHTRSLSATTNGEGTTFGILFRSARGTGNHDCRLSCSRNFIAFFRKRSASG